jgi:hypothetical protein
LPRDGGEKWEDYSQRVQCLNDPGLNELWRYSMQPCDYSEQYCDVDLKFARKVDLILIKQAKLCALLKTENGKKYITILIMPVHTAMKKVSMLESNSQIAFIILSILTKIFSILISNKVSLFFPQYV